MKRLTQMTAVVIVLMFLGLSIANGQTPIGTEFSFQGQLKDAGQAANGSYNMKFELYDDAVGGSHLGTIEAPGVTVANGLFTVGLDFGPGVFNQSRRWLQVTVESTTLSPRQAITGAPYSIETRGLEVVEDGNGMNVGVGRVGSGTFNTFNVYTDSTGFEGMSVETPAGGNPTYGYKSGAGQSVYHYYDYDSESWRLYNVGDRIVVKNDGYVGLNRSDGLVSSEVFGIYKPTAGNQFAGMNIETSAGGRPYYGYGNAGNLIAYHYYDANSTKWVLRIPGGPNGGNVMEVKQNGDFEVFGPFARRPGGGQWNVSSDRRLKKDIKELDGSLENLMKLRGVTFKYRDPKAINELEGTRTGFIAQEVEKVFPNWVDKGDDGYLSLNPRGFTAVAVEAIRELRDEKNAQIETLECKNEELQDENEELRDRMDALELQVQLLVESFQTQR